VGVTASVAGTLTATWTRSIPLQIRAAVPSCTIKVEATPGREPRNQQNITYSQVPPGPTRNILGAYDTLNRPDVIQPLLKGWFYAVQIQVDLKGDTDPSRWRPSQASLTTGTATYVSTDGTRTKQTGGSPLHEDSPFEEVVKRLPGSIDWLDAPGQGIYEPEGSSLWRAISMNYTMTFVSSLHHVNGQSCSTPRWNVVFEMNNGVMNLRFF